MKSTKAAKKAKAKAPAKKVAAPRARAPKAAPAQPAAKSVEFPVLAHVGKSGDKIPVQVTDQAHLDRLIGEHGAGGVEVQS